jgi:hypothetical protein
MVFEEENFLLKRTLIGLFRSFEQTSEKTQDTQLRTRYYQLSKDQLWEEVTAMIKKTPGYKLLFEVKSVGEIIVERRTILGRVQDITITLTSANPVKTSIDIYSASRGSFGDLGSNYRTVIDIFQLLDRKLARYKTSR